MKLRYLIALAVFAFTSYYGWLGAGILRGKPDSWSALVGLILAGGGVGGILLALVIAFGRRRRQTSYEDDDNPFAQFKNMIARIAVGIFGLVALYAGLSGVFTGRMQSIGRRSSAIVFANSPFAFLGMLLFWLALGSFFTWLAFTIDKNKRQSQKSELEED
jgi:hypothetical protein